jgi:Cu(I)/Ag(I) efflux system membrane fusion protein
MRTIIVALIAAAALAAGYWLGMRSHPAPEAALPAAGPSAAKAERKPLYYRNPMGLPDTSPVPKKDPMGMDYIPVYEGEEPPAKAGTVKISLDKVQLLGVRTEPAAERELRRAVQAVGTIQANERLLYKVTPRFEGWIERLRVNTTGQPVRRGEALMDVYSPELVAAQEEYLIALRGIEQTGEPVMQRMAEGVLRRLRNWGIAESELETLRKEGSARQLLTYRSPAAGVVLQKPSVQGMRFVPGETLYEIADLSSVWLVAEVFERDLGLVKLGQPAKLRILAYPEREFTGKVVFISPTLEADTRTARVRVELANAGGLLKPAMYGAVDLVGGHARGKALAVPDSAVLDSGTRQVVLVQRGEGLFEPRSVKLGMRADGYVEVLDGVAAGESVVVRANFLIDAESNLKAALETFGGHGGHGAAPKPEGAKAAQAHRGRGTVESLDPQAGSIEINHGPIATLKWPAMTMEFKVRDKAQLAGLAKGQVVEFELSDENVIERIAPAPAHAGHGG